MILTIIILVIAVVILTGILIHKHMELEATKDILLKSQVDTQYWLEQGCISLHKINELNSQLREIKLTLIV
jgi:hypothetical protein